jgi:hypothetical protein
MDAKLTPANFQPALSRQQVIQASDKLKQFFEGHLRSDFNMVKHTAPLAFALGTGLLRAEV